ncbi:hypothetical protein NDU88_005645 [Pleurodeles waltl]|uniref:Uncharacterized protein n=1 Tax=Pleurodeles waltl TaxID=8319 RepID=A0AAV7TBX0_PLEWA|nr:hypothetical protein NDU88_005645 [Pleurodeles waltl]
MSRLSAVGKDRRQTPTASLNISRHPLRIPRQASQQPWGSTAAGRRGLQPLLRTAGPVQRTSPIGCNAASLLRLPGGSRWRDREVASAATPQSRTRCKEGHPEDLLSWHEPTGYGRFDKTGVVPAARSTDLEAVCPAKRDSDICITSVLLDHEAVLVW